MKSDTIDPNRLVGACRSALREGEMSDDDPITLREAAETFFRGRIKVTTLRAERGRGTLQTFFLGRKEFTTNAFLREMIRCCVTRQAQGSGLTRSDPGLSATDRASSAQAAALETVRMLKNGPKSAIDAAVERAVARSKAASR